MRRYKLMQKGTVVVVVVKKVDAALVSDGGVRARVSLT